jgi:hypothetical protein
VLTQRPDAVVVDIGYPSWAPPAAARIVTFGGGRANLAAAAEQLRGT